MEHGSGDGNRDHSEEAGGAKETDDGEVPSYRGKGKGRARQQVAQVGTLFGVQGDMSVCRFTTNKSYLGASGCVCTAVYPKRWRHPYCTWYCGP